MVQLHLKLLRWLTQQLDINEVMNLMGSKSMMCLGRITHVEKVRHLFLHYLLHAKPVLYMLLSPESMSVCDTLPEQQAPFDVSPFTAEPRLHISQQHHTEALKPPWTFLSKQKQHSASCLCRNTASLILAAIWLHDAWCSFGPQWCQCEQRRWASWKWCSACHTAHAAGAFPTDCHAQISSLWLREGHCPSTASKALVL